MVTNLAIMRDMGVVHQQNMVANARNHASTCRAPMNSGELADAIVITNLQTRGLTLVLQILGVGTNRGKLEDPIASADRGIAFDHSVRTDHGLGTDLNVGPNDGTWTNPYVGAQFGAAVNYGRRMDLFH